MGAIIGVSADEVHKKLYLVLLNLIAQYHIMM